MADMAQMVAFEGNRTELEAVLVQQMCDGLVARRTAARVLESLRSEQRDYLEELRWTLRSIRCQNVYACVLQDLDRDQSVRRGDMVILAKAFGCILPKRAGRRQAHQALMQRFQDIERSCAADGGRPTKIPAITTRAVPEIKSGRASSDARHPSRRLASPVRAVARFALA